MGAGDLTGYARAMRIVYPPAAAVRLSCLVLLCTGGPSAALAAAPTKQLPAKNSPSMVPVANDAPGAEAARHARRTACIKEAKAKKLVGEVRNAYVKDCTDR